MIELRTTERGTFKRCQQQWYWAVKEGLAKRRTDTPLWFGTAVHLGLSEWYRQGFERGPHPAATFSNAVQFDRTIRVPTDSDELEAEYVGARELGIEMLENYVNRYKRDDGWDVIATEHSGHVYLPKRGKTRGRDIKYYFTFDGVYRDLATGLIWLMEHKTAAAINTEKLALDEQASSYWAVCERILKKNNLIKPTDRVAGIMFNFLRKKGEDRRPRNAEGMFTNKPTKEHYILKFKEEGLPEEVWYRRKLEDLQRTARELKIQVVGEPSKMQPLPNFIRHPVYRSPEERRIQLKRIQDDAWHIERAWNDPDYPILKSPSKDCGWCPFFNMCQLHEQGDMEAVEDFKETMYIRRDPFEAYRKAA